MELSVNISLSLDSVCLHPELLEIEKLVEILLERNVSKCRLLALEKHELVDLFYKHVLPLPQRRYRQNRRGREMTKSQILVSKRRRQTQTITPDADEPHLKKSRSDVSATQSTSRHITPYLGITSNTERLKPPPSPISFSCKTLKLNSGNSISNVDNSLTSSNVKSLSSSSSVIRLSANSETYVSADDKIDVVRLKPSPSSLTSSSVSPPTCRAAKSGVLKASTISLINRHLSQDATACYRGTTLSSKQSVNNTSTASATITMSTAAGATSAAAAAGATSAAAATICQGTDSVGKKVKISRISWP